LERWATAIAFGITALILVSIVLVVALMPYPPGAD
jgi:predicted nucleic acid-binding Zn ribbon protein